MQSSVGQLAAAAYKSGGLDPTVQILLADDPESFLQSAVALNQLGRQQAADPRAGSSPPGRASRRPATTSPSSAPGPAPWPSRSPPRSTPSRPSSPRPRQLLGTLKADQLAKYNAASRGRRRPRPRCRLPVAHRQHPEATTAPPPGARRSPSRPPTHSSATPMSTAPPAPSSFDCSGLTMFAWNSAGVSLPHSSSAQYSSTRHVSVSDLQPGDLVFYYSPISHVAIYIGGGRIIHAPHPGRSVEIASLRMMPFSGAARP